MRGWSPISDFFGAKIHHFAIFKTKRPKQHDQEIFLEIFQKNRHISRKKVMYSPRLFGRVGADF
jgi:hypothetical protein